MSTYSKVAAAWRGAALVAGIIIAGSLAAQSGGSSKEADHARMRELIARIEQPAALDAAALAAAQIELATISASLGGDMPGPTDGTAVPGNPNATRVSAPAPPGSTIVTASVTNSTPQAIPATAPPIVLTSTVVVAGQPTSLWDVDLQINVPHTFSSDLDMTLQSPGGTIVTFTSDGGGVNDNVYDGTLFDDQANPAGQVPYVNNNGLVTDHLYANLVLASPLAPEEAFEAFRGENPNGTWTLTVSDDANLDGGSLNSWTLTTHSLAAAPATTVAPVFTNSTAVAIPTGPAVVTSTIPVAGLPTFVANVRVTTNITHTNNGDLDITLASPGGTIVTLTTDNGGTSDNVFAGTLWDDDADPDGQVPYVNNAGMVQDQLYVNLTPATPLAPEEALHAFTGVDPNGTWTLTISDDLAANGGNLVSWSLEITTAGTATTPPIFAYNPAAGGTVNFTGGTTVGSTGTGSIAVTIGTAGSGTGAAATTTTTCTAPTAPFAGFGQTVTAVGSGAITGSPLSGTCTLGAAAVTQTLTCSENRGGTPTPVTFTLSCPAGTLVPLTSNPVSGSTITLPIQTLGGPGTTSTITFTNPGAVAATVTCTAPTATQFTVNPLTIPVAANGGTGSTTVTFSSPSSGTFTGVLNCTAGTQTFTFNLTGTTSVPTSVPTFGDSGRWIVMLLLLGVGLMAVGVRRS